MEISCLVTGGTSDIGRQLVRRLCSEGYNVTVLCRITSCMEDLTHYGAKILVGDLKNLPILLESVKDKDYIFHLGEIRVSDPEFLDSNLKAIQTMISGVSKSSKFKRFVFISSIAVSCFPEKKFADEQTGLLFPMNDIHTAYKRKAEQLLLNSKIPLSILRVSCVYGPGITNFRKIFKVLNFFRYLGGLPFPGLALSKFAFIHIDDLVNIIFSSANEKRLPYTIYNVVDDNPLSIKEFIFYLQEHSQRFFLLLPVPIFLCRWVAYMIDNIVWVKGYPNAEHYLYLFSHDLIFNNSLLKQNLSLSLKYPSVKEGIPSLIQWLCVKKDF